MILRRSSLVRSRLTVKWLSTMKKYLVPFRLCWYLMSSMTASMLRTLYPLPSSLGAMQKEQSYGQPRLVWSTCQRILRFQRSFHLGQSM